MANYTYKKTYKGTTYKNELTFNAAGVTFEGRQGKLCALANDPSAYLTLRREKRNEFDPNAVAIIACLSNGTHMKVGYVPRGISDKLAGVIDEGKRTRVRKHTVVGGGRYTRGCKLTVAY